MDRKSKVRLGVLLGASVCLLPVALWAGQLNICFTCAGFKCCSAATVTVDLKGVPNPSTKPTAVIGTVQNANIEIACKNPANNGIFPGAAFATTILDQDVLDLSDITGKGTARIDLLFPLNSYEVVANCTNQNWIPIVDSAFILRTELLLQWYHCSGEDLDGDGDTDPCVDLENGLPVITVDLSKVIDSKSYVCTPPSTAQRNSDGTSPHVTYTCLQA